MHGVNSWVSGRSHMCYICDGFELTYKPNSSGMVERGRRGSQGRNESIATCGRMQGRVEGISDMKKFRARVQGF